MFDVLLGALKQFIMTKSFLNKKHEFSLVVLNEEAQLVRYIFVVMYFGVPMFSCEIAGCLML